LTPPPSKNKITHINKFSANYVLICCHSLDFVAQAVWQELKFKVGGAGLMSSQPPP